MLRKCDLTWKQEVSYWIMPNLVCNSNKTSQVLQLWAVQFPSWETRRSLLSDLVECHRGRFCILAWLQGLDLASGSYEGKEWQTHRKKKKKNKTEDPLMEKLQSSRSETQHLYYIGWTRSHTRARLLRTWIRRWGLCAQLDQGDRFSQSQWEQCLPGSCLQTRGEFCGWHALHTPSPPMLGPLRKALPFSHYASPRRGWEEALPFQWSWDWGLWHGCAHVSNMYLLRCDIKLPPLPVGSNIAIMWHVHFFNIGIPCT